MNSQSVIINQPENIKKSILIDETKRKTEIRMTKKNKKTTFNNLAEEDLMKYKKLINDPEALIDVEDPFGISRGLCQLCKLDCKGYKPANSLIFNRDNTFPSSCTNCGCGASNHYETEFDSKQIPKEIISILYGNLFSNENINFDGILCVFSINNTSKLDIVKFETLIKEAGINIIAKKTNLLDEKQYDDLVDNIEKFYEEISKGKSEFSKLIFKDTSVRSINFPKNKDKKFEHFMNKHSQKDRKNTSHLNYIENFLNPVLTYCIQSNSTKRNSTINYFKEIYLTAKQLFSSEIKLAYYSQNKIAALWDLQVIFPELFRIKSSVSVISEKIDFFEDGKKKHKNQDLIEHNVFFRKSKMIHVEELKKEDEEFKKYIKEKEILKETTKVKIERIRNIALDPSSHKENPSDILDIDNDFQQTNVFLKTKVSVFPESRSKDFFTKTSNLIGNDFTDDEDEQSGDSQDKDKTIDNSSRIINSNAIFNQPDEKISTNKKYLRKQEKFFIKNLSLYKDFLSLNSIIVNEEFILNNRTRINEIIKKYEQNHYVTNFCNYLLRIFSFSSQNKFIDIIYQSKIGPNTTVNPIGAFDNLDITNISRFKDIDILSTVFFPDQSSYSRLLLVFRPMIVKSGMNQVILNIFKLNGFNIIKKKFSLLSRKDASFLFYFEKIDNIFLDDYINIMTESEVEIIVLSRFSAIHYAKILTDGCLEGNLNYKYSILDKVNIFNED